MASTTRSIKPIPTMAENMRQEIQTTDGRRTKLYKAMSDEHKQQTLSSDISRHLSELADDESRPTVDLRDVAQVKQRTMDYLQACSIASVFPSVMGLAVHGYGMSRQRLNYWVSQNPMTPTADYINRIKDVMADILTNASLRNDANPVQTIFQLKNHFGHTDTVRIEPVQNQSTEMSPDELIREARLLGLNDDDIDDGLPIDLL